MARRGLAARRAEPPDCASPARAPSTGVGRRSPRFYSQLGGITVQELNNLEVEFLFGLNFALHVSPSELSQYSGAI